MRKCDNCNHYVVIQTFGTTCIKGCELNECNNEEKDENNITHDNP